MADYLDVLLRGVHTDTATDALLALESWAEKMYPERSNNNDQQLAYNRLGEMIVIPLREARDRALGQPQQPFPPPPLYFTHEPARGEAVRFTFTTHADDDELRHHEVAVAMMNLLEPVKRGRLLRYLNDRYGVD